MERAVPSAPLGVCAYGTLDDSLFAPKLLSITQAIVGAPRVDRPRWKRLTLQIVSVAALAVGAYVWSRQLDFHQLWQTLTHARVLPLLAVVASAFAGIAWKAGFWRFALAPLRPVPFRELFRFGVAAAVGSILAPGRAGEALRVWVLRHRHGVPLSAALTVAGLEKLGDVGSLVLLATPLAWFVPQLPAGVRPWLLGFSAVPIAAALAIRLIRRHAKWSQLPIFAALRLFDHPRAVLTAMACVMVAWCFDLASTELVLYAIGAKVTLAEGLLVLLLTNLAILLPVTPGSVGAHELASALALKMMGVEAELATAFALLYHGLTTIPVLLVGLFDARRLVVELGEPPRPPRLF